MRRRDRPRYQVLLQLMPGGEPWVRVESAWGEMRMPAACSILELLERLQHPFKPTTAPTGELMVRVPLDVALSSPTIGAYRKRGRAQAD